MLKLIHPPTTKRKHCAQSGNVFLLILIGIALFGALVMTVSRGMNSQSTNTMSSRDAELAAVDILSYAQKVERAVNRLRRRGCSENDISFENNVVSGYTNPNSPSDKSCHVFDKAGGGVNFHTPVGKWLDNSQSAKALYGEILYTHNAQVLKVGRDCSSSSCSELLVYLPFLKKAVCEKINEKLSLPEPSTLNEGIPNLNPASNDRFKGDYGFGFISTAIIGDNSVELTAKESACLKRNNTGGHYAYYHVLIAR